MNQKTIIEKIVKTSARFGSLFIPANSLEHFLGNFAYPLTLWTHDDVYKVRLLGSSIGLIYSGRPILVCSKHQIRDCELSDIGLFIPGSSDFVTSSGSRTFHDLAHFQESDAYDLAAFDFSGPASDYPALSQNFFKFQLTPPDSLNSNILAFIIAGFPSKDQKYELEDRNHLGTVRRVLTAEPESQSADPALLRLKFFEPLDFDPDGLSGGPAFVVQFVEGEPRVFLAGMIVRSGKSHCHILKSGFLWSFLGSFITE